MNFILWDFYVENLFTTSSKYEMLVTKDFSIISIVNIDNLNGASE